MTTDDGTGRLRHARCEGEQNEGEHAGVIHTYIHTYIIIVLSNLSVSDVSIYFVWLLAPLVVRDELEHLWQAIS